MMGLLDLLKSNFTTGETAGIPNQPMKRGLLDDPLMQLGLGILANSQGNSFGTALGKGGMQAFNNLQQNQQLNDQKQLRDLQMQEVQQKLEQAKNMQKAKEAFKLAHPDMADAVDLDPTLAMKAAYPQIGKNSADPYYTVVPTEKGLGRFNARDGSFELIQNPDGSPYVKSTDSPTLQGQISGAKSYNQNLYDPTNMVDGRIVPKSTLAAQSGAPLPAGLPQTQRPSPANFPRVTPQEQGERDNKRLQILLSEQQRIGGAGKDPQLDAEIASVGGERIPTKPSFTGIAVPTKAEQAASEAQAKANVELAMQPQIDAAKKSATMNAEATTKEALDLPQTIANAQNTLRQIDELVGSKDEKIKPHAGFLAAVGLSSKLDPRNYIAGTDATDFNVRLDQLKGGQFLQAYQSLKGGGQITEVEGKKATDAIARMNTASSEKEFVKAARDYQDVIKNGLARAKLRAGLTNKDVPKQTTSTSKVIVVDW